MSLRALSCSVTGNYKQVREAMESTSDPTDAAVRKIIKAAKKGYVTHDQVNAVLHSEEFTPDQIEDVFVMLSEMNINVVERGAEG
jgi:RNA polymerase primary sigma factor